MTRDTLKSAISTIKPDHGGAFSALVYFGGHCIRGIIREPTDNLVRVVDDSTDMPTVISIASIDAIARIA